MIIIKRDKHTGQDYVELVDGNREIADNIKSAIKERFDFEVSSCEVHFWKDDESISIRVFLDGFIWFSSWYENDRDTEYILREFMNGFTEAFGHILKGETK